MQPLIKKELNTNEQKTLNNLQASVNSEADFALRVAKAQKLWDTKGGKKGKIAFQQIRTTLSEMCVFVQVCNYCECSEAGDIEHIYPKSFFPEYAFDWNNYLLICKQCNTGEKLDKCFVLDAQGNCHDTKRGEEPMHKTIAFINPRIENPQDFMLLNTETWRFDAYDDLTPHERHKTLKTIEILELNRRDTLIAGRRNKCGQLYDIMDRLRRVIEATDITTIESALAPYHGQYGIVNLNQPLQAIKEQVRESVKKHIQNQPFPSVWYAIKMVSSKMDKRWIAIFEAVPEAKYW